MTIEVISPIENTPLPRQPWADQVFRPIVLTTMLVCLTLALIWLGQSFNPIWRGSYLLLGVLLVSVETIYSTRLLSQPQLRGISISRYRLIEGVGLALILKVVSYIGQPWSALEAAWQTFTRQPLRFFFPFFDGLCPFGSGPCPAATEKYLPAFFSGDYLLLLGLAGGVWFIVHTTLAEIEALYDPETYLHPEAPPPNLIVAARLGRTYYALPGQQVTPLDRLTLRFFWGGGLLVGLSGLTLLLRQNILPVGLVEASPNPAGIVFNGLGYFVLGLLLLSQARLAALTTTWHIQKTHIVAGLGKRWARSGLLFLGLLGGLALLLPTGYSLGLLDATRVVLIAVLNVLIRVFQVLWLLILLGLSKLFPVEARFQFTPPLAPPSFPAGGPAQPLPWLEILRSLLFWWIFIFGIVYIVRSYLADHPELVERLKRFTPLWWIIGLAATIIVWLVELGRAILGLAAKPQYQSPPAPLEVVTGRRWQPARLNRLSNRQLICYYYLDILHHAQRTGLTRQRHQTPLEYESQLRRLLPSIAPQIEQLTEAFIQARYSRNNFDPTQLAALKTVWHQIRSALADTKPVKPTELLTSEAIH